MMLMRIVAPEQVVAAEVMVDAALLSCIIQSRRGALVEFTNLYVIPG